ncbi:hypothetical protein PMI42_01705 [Bradyrhizobium sp. YR681]|uniref:hypothetical protein n=1 Tax=Bradyrhizobium sp. YR681 TaxID=1144344 RepID=UPI0002712A4C|nr:hypothetical protein [Bradyrhizobium sp. YR681]EJN14732.1 hypothetical protein PMI42_01705 [Bradyrhizobium sp. YR681]
MPDITTAMLNAKLAADLKEQRRTPESRERAAARRQAYNAPKGLVAAGHPVKGLSEDDTVPCFDPWMIARADTNREHAAWQSLRREGCEAWYPAGRKLRQMPKRFLPSKTRNKRHVVSEELRLPYPGYVFFRRLTPSSQKINLMRLYELDGIVGICMFGEHLALAEDHEIQMLRFKEDIGSFDEWDIDLTAKQFALSEVRRSEAAKERWEKPPQVLGALDTNQGPRLYLVEAFGRITRIVAATGDLTVER